MSAHASTDHTASVPVEHAQDSKFHIFVQIAMLLAVITGVEIVIIYLPFASWLIIGSLTLLSVVKFLYVIFYFMHLKWDKMFCTILFVIGLVLTGFTVAALMALFIVEDSVPLTSLEVSQNVVRLLSENLA